MSENQGQDNQSNPELSRKAFKKFYKTPKGQFLAQEISGAISVHWDETITKSSDVLFVGYPFPGFLKTFKKAMSVSIFYPSRFLPGKFLKDEKNITVHGDEAHLPFYPGSFNAVFVFHGLENMDDPVSFLEGLWKVLSPDGRLMLMVPNRLGGWKNSGVPGKESARATTQAETKKLLAHAGFSVLGSFGICYGLPVGFLRKLFFSKILKTLSGGTIAGFPGFIIFEAEKTSGPKKVKFKDPVKASGTVKVPEFIPE